jgi:peptidoglycan/LPS O-acetylase OafA/YrhL
METLQPLPIYGGPRTESHAISPTDQRAHRSDIDGLRAIAVAVVVGFHCGIPWLPGGFVGVDVFFVISGFLIGGLLYEETLAGRFSYANFYARRIRRIAPALIVVITVTCVIALLILSPRELVEYSTYAMGTLLSVPNVVFMNTTGYFAGSAELNPLLMCWSLGVEEQFYIFYPPILLMLMRWRRALIPAVAIGCIASFGINVWMTATHPAVAFYALPPRAWELGCGVLLATWQSRHPPVSNATTSIRPASVASQLLAPAGLCMIFASASLFDSHLAFPGYAALVPVVGTMLVIGNAGSASRGILASRPLVFIGLLSYSWYLWHWPLLSFARVATDLPLSWQKGALVSSVSLAFAYLSFRFVEAPFRRGWRSIAPGRWIQIYFGVVAASVLGIASIHRTGGLPERVADTVKSVEREVAFSRSNSCLAGYGAVDFNATAKCVGASRTAPAVALLGDSHASALRAGVDDFAQRAGLGAVVQLTKSSCPTLLGVSRVMSNHPRHFQECAAFSERALDFVLRSKEIEVVVLAGYWSAAIEERTSNQGYQSTSFASAFTREGGLDAFHSGLTTTIDTLRKSGKRVIVVDDAPLLGFDPAKHMITRAMPIRRALADNLLGGMIPLDDFTAFVKKPDEGVRSIVLSAARDADPTGQSGVSTFSIRDHLCSRGQCQFARDGRLLLADQHHLSDFGASYVARAMH